MTLSPSERRIVAFLALLLCVGYAADLLGVRRTPIPRPPAPPMPLPSLEESPFVDGCLDLNEADARALQSLPGIGPALADRILQYRTKHGPFQRVQDLLNVRGIGPKTLGQLAHKVTVASQRTSPVDSCPKIGEPIAETTM